MVKTAFEDVIKIWQAKNVIIIIITFLFWRDFFSYIFSRQLHNYAYLHNLTASFMYTCTYWYTSKYLNILAVMSLR